MNTSQGSAWEPKFNFCLQVWGEKYIDILMNVGLPTQLTRGNLLDFPWKKTSIYEIYTRKCDEPLIRAHPVFRVLEQNIEVRFKHIDHVMSDNKWPVVRYCHREGVKSADERDAGLFFLCPDSIWGESCFTRAATKIVEGHSAVLCPGLRTVRETIVPHLRENYLSADGISMPIEERKLSKLVVEHLHPEMAMWFWDAPDYYKFPTYIMFDVPGEGISAFCYILHPVVIRAEVRNAPFRLIFDQDYLEAACPDISKIYITRDSDQFFAVEASPRDAPIPPAPRPTMEKTAAMKWYGEWQHNRQHRQFVMQPVRIHHRDCTPEKWWMVEARGFEIVKEIERSWARSDLALLWQAPENLLRRIEGRYRWDPEAISTRDRLLRAVATALTPSTTPTPRWLRFKIWLRPYVVPPLTRLGLWRR